MSFRCQVCKKAQKVHEVPKRIVTKKRVREYINDRGNMVGRGWEIVEEKVSCSPCATNVAEAVLVEGTSRGPAIPVFVAPPDSMGTFGDRVARRAG